MLFVVGKNAEKDFGGNFVMMGSYDKASQGESSVYEQYLKLHVAFE